MEAVGAAASCFALIQAIKKLGEYGSRLKNAPEDWQRYIFALDGLVHMYTDIEKMIKKIARNRRPSALVSTCKENLIKVTDDAEDMVEKFRAAKHGQKNTKSWLRLKLKRRLCFFVDKQQIKDQFEAVEHAKSSLNLALLIATLYQTDERAKHITAAVQKLGNTFEPTIQSLKDLFSAHSKELVSSQEELKKNIGMMSRPIINYYDRRSTPNLNAEKTSSVSHGRKSRKRHQRSKVRMERKRNRSDRAYSSSRDCHEVPNPRNKSISLTEPSLKRDSRRPSGDELSPSKSHPDLDSEAAAAHQKDKKESRKDVSEAFDEVNSHGTDGSEAFSHDETSVHQNRNSDSGQSPVYKLSQMDMDTQGFSIESSFSRSTDRKEKQSHPFEITQSETQISSSFNTSDSDFDSPNDGWAAHLSVENWTEGFGPDTIIETDSSDTSEYDFGKLGDRRTTHFSLKKTAYAIIPDSADVEKCGLDNNGYLQFCVVHLADDEDGQFLTIKEPCTLMPCEHSTIEGIDPMRVDDYRKYISLLQIYGIRSGRRRDFSRVFGAHCLPLFERCVRDCSHTIFEGRSAENRKCMYAGHFKVSVSEEE